MPYRPAVDGHRIAGRSENESYRPVIIATILRPEGITGVHTHFRQFHRYLEDSGDTGTVVTPFSWSRTLAAIAFAPRLLLQRFSGSAVLRGIGIGTECSFKQDCVRALAKSVTALFTRSVRCRRRRHYARAEGRINASSWQCTSRPRRLTNGLSRTSLSATGSNSGLSDNSNGKPSRTSTVSSSYQSGPSKSC